MSRTSQVHLTRRERQIMDVVYRFGDVSIADVLAHIPDPPSYSAVRALVRLLEKKGHVQHKKDGVRYVYSATLSRDRAKKSAIEHLLQTFFDGSTELAVASLLSLSEQRLSSGELDRIAKTIDEARTN